LWNSVQRLVMAVFALSWEKYLFGPPAVLHLREGVGAGGRRRGCCGCGCWTAARCGLCLVVAIRVWFAGDGGGEEGGRGSPTVAVVGVGASLTVGIDHGCASGDVVLAWDVR